MQNAAIEALGLDWVYVPMAVRPGGLGEAVAGARAMGFVGLNCTIPHKEAAAALAEELDDAARLTGAVNTLKFGDAVQGFNTDVYGFTQTVLAEAEITFEDLTVLILGAGGAARGIAVGAAQEGARKVIVANRTRPRAEEVVLRLEASFPRTRFEIVQASEPSLANAAARSDLIVNATSLGLRPDDPLPIAARSLEPRHVVMDTVYTPPETPLLTAARAAGAISVGGLGMLARQGARSLALWSGLEADEDLMLRVLRQTAAAQPGSTKPSAR